MNRTGLTYSTPKEIRAVPDDRWEEWIREKALAEHILEFFTLKELCQLIFDEADAPLLERHRVFGLVARSAKRRMAAQERR